MSGLAAELEGRFAWHHLARPAAALFCCLFLREMILKGLTRMLLPVVMELQWVWEGSLSSRSVRLAALEILEWNLCDVLVLCRHDPCLYELVKPLWRHLAPDSEPVKPRLRA